MKAKELRGLSEEELISKKEELTRDLFNLRFRHASGQLDNTSRLRLARKALARVKTFLRATQLAQKKS